MTENIDPETILRNLFSGFFITQKITALGAAGAAISTISTPELFLQRIPPLHLLTM
ncbi:hypothetical protein [Paenibacillus etheri]|uniref:hypothetical protein n=1 Tax=Paenibacillus etheri TaxID=1306852 RepID=UPI0012E375EB|nr:hypothetical protein [Paenibacillus etheri]